MTKQTALQTVWNYLRLNHRLKKADIIFVLGSSDTRVAEYAAQLYLDGWVPLLLLSGFGRNFGGASEAEVFAEIAHMGTSARSGILIG